MTARLDVLVMATAAFRLKILCLVLWKSARKYAKIKRMRNKKRNLLSRFSLVGVGGVIILGAILKKQCEEKRQEKIKQAIRDYFSRFDNISVLYVNAFESDKERTTGGLVLEDGRTFQFVSQNGEISYEEEKND